jgi:hypothetical protein
LEGWEVVREEVGSRRLDYKFKQARNEVYIFFLSSFSFLNLFFKVSKERKEGRKQVFESFKEKKLSETTLNFNGGNESLSLD